ncbi:sulfite exporter TauE/SafE family protein [Rhodovulum sulfidophilum]|uniref:sulfite exporter TauE/SafE family protein n=1 Tax=Rhodovulum sulfidophilum TaxID=35806 RepID=UPI001389ABE8|nr:sulfite exporter TauE/SafE family protein [Rhodovulum sulfidophilum]NDK33792.1 sulfite exporter TauE/SafE family protein [Rhodovulum sulfidophilum]
MIFGIDIYLFVAAVGVALVAGVVKGAVGFALPMILISGLSSFLPAELALAGLVLATLLTNLAQALRQGGAAAWASVMRYRLLIGCVMLAICVSAPLVPVLSDRVLYLLIGVPITIFTVSQLAGRHLILPARHRGRAEIAMGLTGGFFGGISGVWGPPVIAYLLSFNTEKTEMIRVQGVVFLIGSVMLVFAHLGSGVLNAQSLPFSAALVLPAAIGMWAGLRLQDRLDPVRFRRATLVVLAVAGLNLIRKGLMG